MDQNQIKLAAYLDQASLDPEISAKTIKESGVSHVVLRRAWGKDISKSPDQSCSKIRAILIDNDITPILLSTDIGYTDANTLMRYTEDIDRAITIAKFYNIKHIRFGIGLESTDPRGRVVHEAWMKTINNKCLKNNIMPCLEVSYQFIYTKPAEIASVLYKNKQWGLIYDPTVLIQMKKIQPFTKYWSLLKDRVTHFDIRDHKTGRGPAYPGQGDAQLDLTISDAILSGFDGWFCLEHGLGRKVGNISGLAQIYNSAKDRFEQMLDRLDLGKQNL